MGKYAFGQKSANGMHSLWIGPDHPHMGDCQIEPVIFSRRQLRAMIADGTAALGGGDDRASLRPLEYTRRESDRVTQIETTAPGVYALSAPSTPEPIVLTSRQLRALVAEGAELLGLALGVPGSADRLARDEERLDNLRAVVRERNERR